MAIKFGELRKYISRVEKLSICFEDGHYDNYVLLSDIPEGKYDELYIFGVGMVDVEFPLDVYSEPEELPQRVSLKDAKAHVVSPIIQQRIDICSEWKNGRADEVKARLDKAV